MSDGMDDNIMGQVGMFHATLFHKVSYKLILQTQSIKLISIKKKTCGVCLVKMVEFNFFFFFFFFFFNIIKRFVWKSEKKKLYSSEFFYLNNNKKLLM